MRKMYRSSDLMMKIFSGNKKYIFPRFKLYARVYVRINLVPRVFPLKNGWGFSRPTHFLREKPWGRGCVRIWTLRSCFILTAYLLSHRRKLKDESETALPKDMQQGLVMQSAPPGEVKGAKRASVKMRDFTQRRKGS